MRNWLAFSMIVGILAGCARHKGDIDNFQGNMDSTVHVENHYWGDVDVFVLHDGTRTRLGMVTAATDQTLTLSSRLIGSAGSLQLEAHAVGMPGKLDSETFGYRPGMQINWTLESNMSRATLSIY